jgi:hypothetical protein
MFNFAIMSADLFDMNLHEGVFGISLGDEDDDDDEVADEYDTFLSLESRYGKIGERLVTMMHKCRESKAVATESSSSNDPDSVKYKNEHADMYFNMIQLAAQVIEKIYSIIHETTKKNDKFGNDMQEIQNLWLRFTKDMHRQYNCVEDFENHFATDMNCFMKDKSIEEIMSRDAGTAISDTRYILHENIDNDHNLETGANELFKCTDNVREVMYAHFIIDEIIRLVQTDDISCDMTSVPAVIDSTKKTEMPSLHIEIQNFLTSTIELARERKAETVLQLISVSSPIFYIIKLLAFGCNVMEYTALTTMSNEEKITHMEQRLTLACERYTVFIWTRNTGMQFVDAELQIMSDHIRNDNIINPVQMGITKAVGIQIAKIVNQLHTVDPSAWGFEMYFDIEREVALDTDDQTDKSGDRQVKNRPHTYSEHSYGTHGNQDSAMMRIVTEMILCVVLPNVKKSKYTRVGGG